MTLTEFAKSAGTRKDRFQVVVTFNDETKLKQMDIFLASNQTEAKEKATAAYGRHGIKSIHCELYKN